MESTYWIHRKEKLILYPPRGYLDLQGEMNRMFDQMLSGGLATRRSGRQVEGATGWVPTVDVATKDRDLMIRAELPG